MINLIKSGDKSEQLSPAEHQAIEDKIHFESSRFLHSMVKLGAFANIIGAFFYVWAIYDPLHASLILSWYALMVGANIINVVWWSRFNYSNITPTEINLCLNGFRCILFIICLLWGSTALLFVSISLQAQITTMIFLLSVLLCFAFSTAIDLPLALSSIFCLATPSILYNGYHYFWYDSGTLVHLSISAAFLIMGLYMLAAAFVGNKVVINLFRLSYTNAILTSKLEDMNKFLEQRVQERTAALEKSLKLVTYQATHDLLTELPNERLLSERITEATQRAIQKHYKFAVVYFSLNNMMKINDGLGHQAASILIQRVSKRFTNKFEKNEHYFISLSQRGNFVMIIEPIRALPELETYIDDLFAVLQEPFYVSKQSLKLTGSAGISIFPDHGHDIDTLVTNAEGARVLAAQIGGNSRRIYSEVINADASRQLSIENLLYHAVDKNELILQYQPFFSLHDGSICGAEALVRWKNKDLGLVPPLDFIPLAEMNGMIIPIGEWVLRTACEQLKTWQDSGYKSFSISVNLSAKQLENKNLTGFISGLLDTLQMEPKYLELELTESEIFQKEAIPIINQFSEKGILLAIDDFGTGYSEFSSLKFFKVNKIKIDKIFIQDIDVSVDSRSIVNNTITLAKKMKIKCIAEGVETKEQMEFLKENGCDMIQGYYFSRPLNAEDFFELLKTHKKSKLLGKS